MRYLAAALIALTVTACSSTEPAGEPPTATTGIEAAEVFVGGSPASGGAISGEQGPSLFQVQLRDRDPLHLESVERCAVHYDLPGDGLLPLRRLGEQPVFDDGSHGDDVPGDGVFHWLDEEDTIGGGRIDAPAGDYQYRFHCRFEDGSESDAEVTVFRQCSLPAWDGGSLEPVAPSC